MSTWKYSDFESRLDAFADTFKGKAYGSSNALVPTTIQDASLDYASPVPDAAVQEEPACHPRIAAIHLDASPVFAACTVLVAITLLIVALQYKSAVEQLTSEVAEGVAAATYLIRSSGDCLVGLKSLAEGFVNHAADLWCVIVGGSSCLHCYNGRMEYAQLLKGSNWSRGRWQGTASPNTPRLSKPTPLPRTKELVDGMTRLEQLVIDLDTERHISDALFAVSKPKESFNIPVSLPGIETFLPLLSEMKYSRDRTRSQISSLLQSLSYQYQFLKHRYEQPGSPLKTKLLGIIREREDLHSTVLIIADETARNMEIALREARECTRRSQKLRSAALAHLSAIRDWMQHLKKTESSRGLWCRAFSSRRCVLPTEVEEIVAALTELVVAIGPVTSIVDQVGQQCDQLGSDLVNWMSAFNFTLGISPNGAVSWQFAKPKVILETLEDTVALAK